MRLITVALDGLSVCPPGCAASAPAEDFRHGSHLLFPGDRPRPAAGGLELFPISSLGHSVVLPRALGWDIHQNDDYFLSFLVATHCATALVLLGFFLQDWRRIITGLGRSLRDRYIDPEDSDAKLGWLLVSARSRPGFSVCSSSTRCARCSPPPRPRRSSFSQRPDAVRRRGASSPRARRRPSRHRGRRRASPAGSTSDALGIGSAQALALIPGLSRSGASDGRRTDRRPLQRGGRALRLPARHPDHRRCRRAQAARAARLAGRPRPRPGPGRRPARRSPPTSRSASCCGSSRPTA